MPPFNSTISVSFSNSFNSGKGSNHESADSSFLQNKASFVAFDISVSVLKLLMLLDCDGTVSSNPGGGATDLLLEDNSIDEVVESGDGVVELRMVGGLFCLMDEVVESGDGVVELLPVVNPGDGMGGLLVVDEPCCKLGLQNQR